jgi:methylmalonyl-CoA/ethylmalonyl-CoA epimerase
MLKVKNIDHVAIAVSDLQPAALDLGRLLGLREGAPETVRSQKTDVLFLQPEPPGGRSQGPDHEPTSIELCCPSPGLPEGTNQSLQRFLDKRGPGLHHICFEVDDLADALSTLKDGGVPLIDETPRPGARGHLVAFIHPRATGGVLIELCQKSQGDPA